MMSSPFIEHPPVLATVSFALHGSCHHAGRLVSYSVMSSQDLGVEEDPALLPEVSIRYEGKDGATGGRQGLFVFMHWMCLWCDVHLGNNG